MLEIINDYWLFFLIGRYPHGPLGGLAGTLALASVCLVLALPCSMLIAIGRTGKNRFWRAITFVIVYVMRGTTFLMIIFWAHFLGPIFLAIPLAHFGSWLSHWFFMKAPTLQKLFAPAFKHCLTDRKRELRLWGSHGPKR